MVNSVLVYIALVLIATTFALRLLRMVSTLASKEEVKKKMINFKAIKKVDPEVYESIVKEYERQNNQIELIASENVPSEAVLMAQASYHTLKYAEGYPNARYYAGCENIDATEQLAIDRVCQLFKCKYANVQPHSGASANLAVQFAFLKPGDTLMGMSLNSGGHLTHGAAPTYSGKTYNVIQYDVDPETYLLDYDNIAKKIETYEPRLFIAGASAYPRIIAFSKIREIIDRVNNKIYERDPENYLDHKIYFMVDMAHIAGLVAAGMLPSPFPYADVVTSTTHKTLRGPRGGIILWNNQALTKRINSAVFPGVQGGPLENIIAAKAVCFKEASTKEFAAYQYNVITNARCLAESLQNHGLKLITDGTDNHLILIDLRNTPVNGVEAESRLKSIGIITNKNAIPFDTQNKRVTSGLRIGTPAVTSRGFGSHEMRVLGHIIASVLLTGVFDDQKKEYFRKQVRTLTKKFPL